MSETVIVNRTPETDGVRRERLRLEAETASETVSVEPESVLSPADQELGKTMQAILAVSAPKSAANVKTILLEQGERITTEDFPSTLELPEPGAVIGKAPKSGFNSGSTDGDVDKAFKFDPDAAKRVAEVLTSQTEVFEKNEDEPSLAEVAQAILASRAPRDPDLAEFKKQVIAAFKHLGLDTRKHFGV